MTKMIWQMRIPDLKLLVQNSYEIQKKEEFFMQQEVLLGKSICDLNLENAEEVEKALDYTKANTLMNINTM